MKRKRRSFTAEFKAECVRLVREGEKIGKSAGAIARELDLTETSLRAWVKKADIDGGGGGKGALTTSEREELIALRKRVRLAEMERDILKKATAFFAKEST